MYEFAKFFSLELLSLHIISWEKFNFNENKNKKKTDQQANKKKNLKKSDR